MDPKPPIFEIVHNSLWTQMNSSYQNNYSQQVGLQASQSLLNLFSFKSSEGFGIKVSFLNHSTL